MLQLATLRNHTDLVKERLAIKNFKEINLVDEIIALDDERKRLQAEFDNTQARSNSASKEIGKLMGQGKKDEAEALKSQVSGFKSQVGELNEKLNTVEKTLQEKLVILPNLPAALVPPGKAAEDNVVVRTGGDDNLQLPANAVPHWELITKYDIVDFETGVKITGRGFPVYKGRGA